MTRREFEAARDKARSAVAEGSIASASSAPPPETPDTYKDRLLKYIPAEIVAIYLALLNIVKTAQPDKTPINTIEWIVFALVLIVTVPWQRRVMKITKWPQVVIGTLAFVFWAISLGDPFDTSWVAWYQPLYGTMVLMFYTFLIPIFEG